MTSYVCAFTLASREILVPEPLRQGLLKRVGNVGVVNTRMACATELKKSQRLSRFVCVMISCRAMIGPRGVATTLWLSLVRKYRHSGISSCLGLFWLAG